MQFKFGFKERHAEIIARDAAIREKQKEEIVASEKLRRRRAAKSKDCGLHAERFGQLRVAGLT